MLLLLLLLAVQTSIQNEKPMSDKVDVTGIDRKELLRALWENSKPAAFLVMNNMVAPFDMDEAVRSARPGTGYVDYACGRLIKAEIFTEDNEIDPRGYDRDYGEGAFQRVVNSLKKQ